MTPLAALTTGFVFALVNAAHCAGMCGVFSLRAAAAPGRLPGFLAYGVGKTFTYVFFGAVAAAFGKSVLAAGTTAQTVAGISVGALMIVVAVMKLAGIAPRPTPGSALAAFLQPMLSVAGRSDSFGGRFTLGALTAALPCGVVYLAALQAAATGSALSALALMGGLGMGTLPALAAVGLLGRGALDRLPARHVRLLGGGLLLALGIIAVVRAALPLVHGGSPASCCH